MSPLTRPFNPVLALQMKMGAALDTQSQVAESAAVWAKFGITPATPRAWLADRESPVAHS